MNINNLPQPIYEPPPIRRRGSSLTKILGMTLVCFSVVATWMVIDWGLYFIFGY